MIGVGQSITRAMVHTGIAGLVLAMPIGVAAADLYRHDAWPALTSDRVARHVGDTLTILIYENAVASNSAQNGSKKNSRVAGQISAGSSLDESGQIEFGGNFDGASQTGRAGKMVAQISVTVDELLLNGDLHVSGEQSLKINGERTNIKLRGRVRPADISANNAILSTRLADAAIDYDGTGFVSRGVKPGIVTRIFAFLGLL